MRAEIEFLRELEREGYFKIGSFDPHPVFEVARRCLGFNVSAGEENECLTAVINGLVREGLVTFEYSQDPALHPKDIRDHWRLVLKHPDGALPEK